MLAARADNLAPVVDRLCETVAIARERAEIELPAVLPQIRLLLSCRNDLAALVDRTCSPLMTAGERFEVGQLPVVPEKRTRPGAGSVLPDDLSPVVDRNRRPAERPPDRVCAANAETSASSSRRIR